MSGGPEPAGPLVGQVVLVTGAGGGIGSALVAALAAAGATAIASDAPGRGAELSLDVADPAAWTRAAETIEATHTRLDGLVNNAGIVRTGSIDDCALEDWRATMAVNLDGVFFGCRAMWPLLRRSTAAAIVNVSSVSGIVGGANLAAYNASKGGVRLLTKSIALHGAGLTPPIRCNSVHPSFVEGPMTEGIAAGARDQAVAIEKMRRSSPLKRMARPEEVASAILHLLSPAASFTTGAELVVDGGLTAS